MVNIPFFEDFENIIPPWFLCCLYISPLLWKKQRSFGVEHGATSVFLSRTDMIFTVSYRRRFGSEMGGGWNAWHRLGEWLMPSVTPPNGGTRIFVCPYDIMIMIVDDSCFSCFPRNFHSLRLPIARQLPGIGQRLSDPQKISTSWLSVWGALQHPRCYSKLLWV